MSRSHHRPRWGVRWAASPPAAPQRCPHRSPEALAKQGNKAVTLGCCDDSEQGAESVVLTAPATGTESGHAPWRGSRRRGGGGFWQGTAPGRAATTWGGRAIRLLLLPGTAQLPAARWGCVAPPKMLGLLLRPWLAAHQGGRGAEPTAVCRGLILGTYRPQGLSPPGCPACRDARGGPGATAGPLLFPKHRCCPPGVLGLGQEQRRHWESHWQPWGAGMDAGAPLRQGGRSVCWGFAPAGRGQHTQRGSRPQGSGSRAGLHSAPACHSCRADTIP